MLKKAYKITSHLENNKKNVQTKICPSMRPMVITSNMEVCTTAAKNSLLRKTAHLHIAISAKFDSRWCKNKDMVGRSVF